MTLQFEKWEGTGNDFVLVDGRQAGPLPSTWSDDEIRELCDRKTGVGSDGVLVVTPEGTHDLHVDFRNPDGSRSFCGNGTRCALAWALDAGLVQAPVQLHAVDGLHVGTLRSDGTPGLTFRVPAHPELREPMLTGSFHACFIDTGSPHHIEWLRSESMLSEFSLNDEAPSLRHHEMYAPSGTNVNVVASEQGILHIRTFERGVEDETLSCGTGVVAAALGEWERVSTLEGSAVSGRRALLVEAKGGQLEVVREQAKASEDEEIWLFGSARHVFSGVWVAMFLLLFGLATPQVIAAGWTDQLTDDVRISVLTASPGEDLYAAFGHTAFRVWDPLADVDLVFNYGTFVVDDGFYRRFVKGKMDYRLGVEPYPRFQHMYLRQGRALHEQVLNVSPLDAKSIAKYLAWNAEPENATYAYDFFRDNCATKVLDVFEHAFGARLDSGCEEVEETYLEAVHRYTQGFPWSAWGIELILGWKASSQMPPCGQAFLPDGMSLQLSQMTLDMEPLAFPVEEVFPAEGYWMAGMQSDWAKSAPSRAAWGWLIWLWVTALPFQNRGRSLLHRCSVALTGLFGIALFLLFLGMQLFTDHVDTWWNADAVWAIGGWGVLVMSLSKPSPNSKVSSNWKRVGVVWSVLAVLAVTVLPCSRSFVPWHDAVLGPSIAAALAVVSSWWMIWTERLGRNVYLACKP